LLLCWAAPPAETQDRQVEAVHRLPQVQATTPLLPKTHYSSSTREPVVAAIALPVAYFRALAQAAATVELRLMRVLHLLALLAMAAARQRFLPERRERRQW